MRFFLFVFFTLSVYASMGQFVAKEEFISAGFVSSFALSTDAGAGLKGTGYLYFNDSSIIINVEGLNNKTFFFKIFKKRYDPYDKYLHISAFDSAMYSRHEDLQELKDSLPELVITINTPKDSLDNERIHKMKPPVYLDLTLYFYRKGFLVNFSKLTFQPQRINATRKRFAKYLIW